MAAKTEQQLEREAAESEKSMAQRLKEMPKVQILIPDDPQNPSDKVVPISCGGVTYAVPRGIPTEVPQAIAEIWNDSYVRTREAYGRIENSTRKEIKVM
jgi:hypothetical protein